MLKTCREKGDEVCFKVNFTSPVTTVSSANPPVSPVVKVVIVGFHHQVSPYTSVNIVIKGLTLRKLFLQIVLPFSTKFSENTGTDNTRYVVCKVFRGHYVSCACTHYKRQ